jgi:molybdate transport system substrate-binding protein
LPSDRGRAARLSLLTASLLLIGAASSAQQPIRIFAAASLTDALSEAIADFENTRADSNVVAQFGGSSDLARQILAGAPAELFFSADRAQLDRIDAEGFIGNRTRADVLSNQLVVVRHRDAPDNVSGPADLATLGRIAMADPEAVPAGVYARRYLEAHGLWPRLRANIVPTLDVRGALAAVASGNIDAGIVYRTDASIDARVRIVHTVARDDGPRIRYSLGLVTQPGTRERPEARALYDYMRSNSAGDIFSQFGFIVLRVDGEFAEEAAKR